MNDRLNFYTKNIGQKEPVNSMPFQNGELIHTLFVSQKYGYPEVLRIRSLANTGIEFGLRDRKPQLDATRDDLKHDIINLKLFSSSPKQL